MSDRKTILITGCAGFIGSNLAEKLISNGNYIIGIDNFDSYYSREIKEKNISQLVSSSNFKIIEDDIRNQKVMENLISESDIIIHLAARAGVRPSIENPMLYQSVNIEGTNVILEAMRKLNKKLIFASSSSVYGNNKSIPFSEKDSVDFPISPYAATKKSGELLCYTYHHLFGIDVACLRFFTVYGPRQRPEMAIHLFTDLIEKVLEIKMFGDGSTARDYTYIDDIIQGIECVIENLKGYNIYNFGENQTTTLKELINIISKKLGKNPIIKTMPSQPGDVENTFADISKAKTIGYNPQTKINEGIDKFVKWYKENSI